MPAPANFNQFSAGWCPSDDDFNGRKNALLKMDNLELDKNGSLSLSGGTAVLGSAYANNAHTLYSNLVGATRHDYVADTAGSVFRDGSSIATGGDSTNAAFAQAFDYTLIASGTIRKKDTGAALVNLGIGKPTASVSASLGQFVSAAALPTSYNNCLGTNIITDPSNFVLSCELANDNIALIQSSSTIGPIDLTDFSGSGGGGPQTGTDDDTITFMLSTTLIALTNLESIQLNIDLVQPSSCATSSDCFVYSAPVSQILSNPLIAISYPEASINNGGANVIFRIPRSKFQRIGTDGIKGWNTVYGYTIYAIATTPLTLGFNAFSGKFAGGTSGPLYSGTYEYMQVNVNVNGAYVGKSQMGNEATFTLNSAAHFYATITPQDPSGIDTQVNQVWIFRRGGLLQQWYRVLIIKSPWSAAIDSLSDADAITLGITFNVNLVSIASASILDKIFDIIGPLEGRWMYFTTNILYPSDINSPDVVDPTKGVRTTGSSSEIFLSARRISDSSIIVNTSRDSYLLTGTFQTLPDGTIDLYYRSLGNKTPAITYDATQASGQVFYLAADGWRSIDGNGNCQLLVAPNTDRLYRGITAYGYSVNTKITAGSTRFPCVYALNKLWCGITGQSRIEVLDSIRNYWRNFAIGQGSITAITSTQDGQILAFFAGDKKLRRLDVQSSLQIDGSTNQTINILTPRFDGGTPRQRKEVYTLKIRLQTGSTETLAVSMIDDTNTSHTIGTVTSNGKVTEQFLDLELLASSVMPLTKWWQLSFTGTFSAFTLEDVEIDFDTRPLPISFLHLLPTDFGHPGRKRIPAVPFIIDTLSNDVPFQPYLDGSPLTAKTVNSSRQQSFDYQFTDDEPARDWEFKIGDGNHLFEFIGLSTPDYIEKLPEPKKFYLIPTTNLGSPNKKRLRVWPFIMDTLGNDVVFHPVVDGNTTATSTFNGAKQTFFHFFESDVFGVDYGGYFTGGPFEPYEIGSADVVQTLPIARRFDQVGPEELFRYGRLKQHELRVMCFGGTAIPVTYYFNDNKTHTDVIETLNGKEGSFFSPLPQGVGGSIVRIEYGPTTFNFHRFYTRLQVYKTGRDTELEWITLPDPASGA